MNKPLEFDMWLHEVCDRTRDCRVCPIEKISLPQECALVQIKGLYREYKKEVEENA